jgi:hypothetical protein
MLPLGLISIWSAFFQLLPDHASDKSWPHHARFHVSWAAGKLCALGINQIILALIPFRTGHKWSWFALASNFVFGGLAIVPSSLIHMGPLGPFRLHDNSTKMVLFSWMATIVGLAIGGRELFQPQGVNPLRRA